MPERCPWGESPPEMIRYHDMQWGVPVHEDRLHFEFIVLEGAQAGLSWLTVLRRQEAYREAFANFQPEKVALFGEMEMAALLENPGIIRNRLKVRSAVKNARAFLDIQASFGSFDAYIWRFVGGRPIQNSWQTQDQLPAETDQSQAMSKDLKKRGFSFVGPTICYAYMQAAGFVNDHLIGCFRHNELKALRD